MARSLVFVLLSIFHALSLGGQESDPAGMHSQTTQQPPQFYGVFVGVSRYGGNLHADLLFPDEDVKILAGKLRLCAGELYGAAHMHIQLLNTDTVNNPGQWPDKAAIKTAIGEVARRARPGDAFFLYFSGNGFIKKDSLKKEYGFLLPQPTREETGKFTPPDDYHVSSTEVFAWLEGIQTNKKVWVLESSYDGQAILDYKHFHAVTVRGAEADLSYMPVEEYNDSAYAIRGRYSVDGDAVQEEGILFKGGKPVPGAEFKLNGVKSDVPGLVEAVVEAVWGKVK